MSQIVNQSNSNNSGMISKDLHKWIIGAVVAFISVMVIFQFIYTASPQETKLREEQDKTVKSALETKPQPDAVKALISQQEEKARLDQEEEERRKEAQLRAEYERKLQIQEEEKRRETRSAIEGRDTNSTATSGSTASSRESDYEEKQREKEAQLRETALASPIIVNKAGTTGSTQKAVSKGQQMLADYTGGTDQVLKQLAALATGQANAATGENPDENWQDKTEKKAKSVESDSIQFNAPPKKPTIFQGTLIPAVLETKIVSDLPGDLRAKVLMDVYDSVDQKTIIIPKGSTLVGKYNNQVKLGQSRVMFAFYRVITPNGRSANLGAMAGMDQIGAAGLKDEVDTHFWDMFWSSLLIAGVAVVAENETASQGSPSFTDMYAAGAGYNMGAATRSAAGQVLVESSKNALKRYTDLPPTIMINPGMRFNVFVNKDMSL